MLVERLRRTLQRINTGLPDEAIEEAIRKTTRAASPSLVVNNRAFHQYLTAGRDACSTEGVDVS